MGFISRTATENETTTAPKIFRQVVSAKPAMTINEIISRELTVADFTDSEILDLAYGIKFADMPGQYWNTVARPQFLARLHALEAAGKKPVVEVIIPDEKLCSVCHTTGGRFTTLSGGDICDDCI